MGDVFGQFNAQARMLEKINAALDQHKSICDMDPLGIAIHPDRFEELGWDDFKGIPFIADDGVHPDRLRLICNGSAHGIENALEDFKRESAPVPGELVPAGPLPVEV